MFSEANISPEAGAELLIALGLDAFEIQKPEILRKYLEIARYFEKFSDGAQVARIVGKNANKVEKLDKVLEYTMLRRSLDEVRARKSELPSSDTVTGETPEALALAAEEAKLIQEIRMYE